MYARALTLPKVSGLQPAFWARLVALAYGFLLVITIGTLAHLDVYSLEDAADASLSTVIALSSAWIILTVAAAALWFRHIDAKDGNPRRPQIITVPDQPAQSPQIRPTMVLILYEAREIVENMPRDYGRYNPELIGMMEKVSEATWREIRNP